MGTALAFGARKLNWYLVDGAAISCLVLVWSGKLIVGAPYFDAPGLAIVTLGNRNFRWDMNAFHIAFGVAVILSVVLLALRHRRGVPALAAALLCAWLLTGEIYATHGNTDYANVFAKMLPAPRDWVDTATHGAKVTFLGQGVTDGNPLWLTEFWNRNVRRVGSLNGVAPGPGPIFSPSLVTTDGKLDDYNGDPYTLTANGVRLAAPIVAQRDGFTLYRTETPWRLLEQQQNVYADGQAANPITYTYFPRGGPGKLVVSLSAHVVQLAGAAGEGDDPRRHREARSQRRARARPRAHRASRTRSTTGS